ncbi:MAG: YkgJ family cysteine cluster protein, partial [Anaerolineae bacterium]
MADDHGKHPDGELMLGPEARAEFERGLRFSHVMMTANRDQANEVMAYIQALGQLLVEKGIILPEDFTARLEQARTEVNAMALPRVHLADSPDKYAESQNVLIDCENRVHLCKARCCTFRFFLTKQDLKEGVAEWDYGNPYWVKQEADGYCTHIDRGTLFCKIHTRRPAVCRGYDCRKDSRIWIDFENYIPAPIEAAGQPNDDPFNGVMPIGSGARLIQIEEEKKRALEQAQQ